MADLVSNQSRSEAIRDNFDTFCTLCDASLLQVMRERIEDLNQEWQRIEARLKSKASNLKVLSSLSYLFFFSFIHFFLSFIVYSFVFRSCFIRVSLFRVQVMVSCAPGYNASYLVSLFH